MTTIQLRYSTLYSLFSLHCTHTLSVYYTRVIQLSAAGLISAEVVGVERLGEKESRKAEDE